MSDRRSSRPRKQVDYSKFGVISVEDDDGDFVDDLTPPPPQKRAKKETKAKKDPQQKATATGKDGKRRSLDEKLYARDLQLALEKSTATKELKSPSNSSTDSSGSTGPEKVMVENKEVEGTAASATLKITDGFPQSKDDQKDNQPDNNNDEDYNMEKEDMSSDDDESDEVSDFEDTLKHPAKKKTSDCSTKKVKTTSPAEGKPAKKTSRQSTKLKPNVPLTSKIGLPTRNSSHIVTMQPAARKQVPQLAATSYRSPLGGVSLRSPGGSTLRLGLSRRANVKPLHVMAKMPQ